MKHENILLDHGSGGRASSELIQDIFLPYFNNPILSEFGDGAILQIAGRQLAFSTDSYTVDPIFFPGGNIGSLAVNGTVNDLAMCGAEPLYLSVGFIIEEGFPVSHLKKIGESMKQAASEAGVEIVTGDTKVVQKKAADKIFINTSGVGIIPDGILVSPKHAGPGDRIIVSGFIADHGVTILTKREGLSLNSSITSDTAPLNRMVQEMTAASKQIHTLRDPTRGGIATSLNEIAEQAEVGITLEESKIPIRDETKGACKLLGLDALYLANEGKLLACVAHDDVDRVLATMRANPYGRNAAVIGEVISENPGKVFMETRIGGTRMIDMLTGEPLPRIC